MSIVAPENGSTQDVQRNVEFVNRPRGLVFQSNITLKLLCQAIDETRPKTVPRRLLDRRTALLGPCQLEPLRFFIDCRRDVDASGRVGQRTVLGRIRA